MIPRILLAHLPTAVEAMPRLTAALGGPRLFVKRDDQTGVAFGGNKTRKLEYVLAEAQAGGARTLITVGGIQSNHCRQTAALAARLGMRCILVLSGEPSDNPNGNVLLDNLFGAKLVWTTRAERDRVAEYTFDVAWEEGDRPYLIPLGASTPTGAVGYVTAFEEFIAQQVSVDWIIVASSSAGTQAGLALGAKLVGWRGKVLGISIDHPAAELQADVARLASEASDRLGKPIQLTPEEVFVNDQYLGGGYAVMGEPEIEAIKLFASTEGLLLDPVYTGRAAAGMIDLIRKGYFKSTDRLLFWHTGGTPALFAEPYARVLYGGD
ncbi:MAG TPA: D-cysteine desulfhydrase family protein [Anaerolineaceae bacterium]|nr:D-cysteine desulfhydrase family protein [Anaerolineaceae bacterium]